MRLLLVEICAVLFVALVWQRWKQPATDRNLAEDAVRVLLLVAIVFFVSAICMPYDRHRRGPIAAAKTQITVFKTALNMFEVDTGVYPKSLEALLVAPGTATNWHGPYLEGKLPVDVWGHPDRYAYPGHHNKQGFDIWSLGPDGKEGSEDDLTNWQ